MTGDKVSLHTHPLAIAQADYDVVRRALAFITDHWRQQPELDEIAERKRSANPHLSSRLCKRRVRANQFGGGYWSMAAMVNPLSLRPNPLAAQAACRIRR